MSLAYPRYRSHTRLFVLSGPSGAGKSTLIHKALESEPNCVMSVSATTRSPRGQEQDGVDYDFCTPDEFQAMIDNDELLEYAQVFGKHFYGTPRKFVDDQFAQGKNVIMDIDVQGAMQIRERMPEDSVLIFVTPPDQPELERRLRARGTDEEVAIKSRLDEADREIEQWKKYDYLIINDDMELSVKNLRNIIGSARLRTIW